MSSSRSRFYVETPVNYVLPEQRHSMYVDQSEAESRVQKQDLSSASSSNTLPSTSGSVDRLTGLSNEKKSHRFFTLKPKTSFSLRPFFSTNSIASLSPSKKRRKTDIASRRDSYVQTDDNKRVYDEVGVQTQNASTVDVPVQTCSNEWDEGDTCIGRKSPAIKPTFSRFPYGSFSTRCSPSSLSKPPGLSLHDSKDNKSSYVSPLDSSKLLKYASPLDSANSASKRTSAELSGKVKSSDSVPPVECLLSSKEKPVESPSEKVAAVKKDSENLPLTEKNSVNISTSSPIDSSRLKEIKPVELTKSSISQTPEKNQVLKSSSDPKITLFRTSDSPTSVLKTDRTDSPKPSKPKTVHFQLSDSNTPNLPSILDSNNSKQTVSADVKKPRNVDQEFEELLRNLDIITDDSDVKNTVKSTGAPVSDISPKPNYISPDFKSALDALKQDFLSPIPESDLNQDDSSKVNEKSTKLNETISFEKDKFEENKLNTNLSDKIEIINTFTPTCSEDKKESNISVANDESYDSTSPASAKLDANVETIRKPEKVYDKVNTDEPVKTVFLPTLPSFFEASSECENLVSDKVTESNFEFPNSVSTDLPNTNIEDEMLSRSSSRSSMRSNPRSDFEECLERTSKFDSCENLDQLEEEIIRSLYSPNDDNFSLDLFAPNTPNIESPSPNNVPTVRRAILDRLLSGESVDQIMPCGTNIVGNEGQIVQPTDVRNKFKRGKKYTATLSKYEEPEPESYPTSYFDIYQSNSPFLNSTIDFKNNTSSLPNTPTSENGKCSMFLNTTKNIESSKESFLFPDTNPPSSGIISPLVKSISSNGITNTNLINNSSTNTHVISNSSNPSAVDSGKCDFAHCLRPSKIQNSPFLSDLSSKSCSPNSSFVEKPAQFSVPFTKKHQIPTKIKEMENPQQIEKCDYANCLKPSQVQNSIFTAELSEITANKSSNLMQEPLIPGYPATAPTDVPQTLKGDVQNSETSMEHIKEDIPDDNEDCRHVSEITIILQTPSKTKLQTDSETKEDEEIEVLSTYPTIHPDKSVLRTTDQAIEIQNGLEMTAKTVPPPPPPPPPFSVNKENIQPWKKTNISNPLNSKFQDQSSNLVKSAVESIESRSNKTPVVLELEKRFEKRSQSDPEVQFSNLTPHSNSNVVMGVSNLETTRDKKSENNNESSDRFTSLNINSHKTETNGFSDNKFQSPSLVNGRQNQNGFSYSPNTVITNEPPPPGALLVDKKVTVDGDKVHTDKYYALPVKEITKETTSTTKFIPAPPKYDGIGPTEDGIPIGLRNSVKKENMHNWYKTMFKSLHKADSSNDPQEYIIGYSSEPESNHRDKVSRKKSATLDNRSNYNNSSNVHNNNFGRTYSPVSAKSSIEIYNVKPRLIEDYEPGQSSVTDDEIVVGSKRFLPPMNVPKTSYEFKNGYEQDNHFTKTLVQPDPPTIDQQKTWYKEIQLGKDIPHYGLAKTVPEKPKEPVIGPLPPPPLNYNGPTVPHQATRPLTLPSDYLLSNGNGVCHQMNGAYEIQMRQAIHSELHQRLSPSSSQLSSPTRSILKSPCKSPDLKIPAQALFDFKAESPKEIPLKKGDNVLILRQLDKNWYEGEKQGVIGIFPINYIEIIPPEHASLPQSSYEGVGKVLYDFTAHTPVELTVKKHDTVTLLRRVDSNWFEAQLQSKKGIIPVTYLQVLKEPIGKTTPLSSPNSYSSAGSKSIPREGILKTTTPSTSPYSNTSSSSSMTNGRNKLQNRNKKNSNLIEPAMYRAMYSYTPQNSDELDLAEGDTIYVVEMCDDGWYVGTSVRTGVFGIFPGNYVEKV